MKYWAIDVSFRCGVAAEHQRGQERETFVHIERCTGRYAAARSRVGGGSYNCWDPWAAAGAIGSGNSISGNVGASSNTNGSTVIVRCVTSSTVEEWSVR